MNELPTYRLITGVDDAEFCRRVSAVLALGYELHAGPAITHDGTNVVVAQAVVWPGADPPRSSESVTDVVPRRRSSRHSDLR